MPASSLPPPRPGQHIVATLARIPEGVDVRFGSLADIRTAQGHVRFTPNSDRKCRHAAMAMSAFLPKADVCSAASDVCYGPIADMVPSITRIATKQCELGHSALTGAAVDLAGFGGLAAKGPRYAEKHFHQLPSGGKQISSAYDFQCTSEDQYPHFLRLRFHSAGTGF